MKSVHAHPLEKKLQVQTQVGQESQDEKPSQVVHETVIVPNPHFGGMGR